MNTPQHCKPIWPSRTHVLNWLIGFFAVDTPTTTTIVLVVQFDSFLRDESVRFVFAIEYLVKKLTIFFGCVFPEGIVPHPPFFRRWWFLTVIIVVMVSNIVSFSPLVGRLSRRRFPHQFRLYRLHLGGRGKGEEKKKKQPRQFSKKKGERKKMYAVWYTIHTMRTNPFFVVLFLLKKK